MRRQGADLKEGKILKTYKDFGGWMSVEITAARERGPIASYFLGAARQHDPRSFQRIAAGPLIQHQGDSWVGENVFGVQRKPRNQQDRRAIHVACDIYQRAIRIATAGH